MRYLVTGGAGFIGARLCERLLEQGAEVRVLDDYSGGRRARLAGLPLHVLEGDVRDAGRVADAVRGVDVVFHLAALCSVERSLEDPRTTHAVNATGTLNVLEASLRAGVRRVVAASSAAVYGDLETLPLREDMKPLPLSPYAASKLVGEHYCKVYWRTFGLETVVLRYFNVFGPGQPGQGRFAAVIPAFLRALQRDEAPLIHGDGSQTRDFLFLDDTVRANLAAAACPAAAGKVINVASGQRRSVLDVLDSLEDLLGRRLEPRFAESRAGEVTHSQACIEKARELLGFHPATGFEEGLRRTLESFAALAPGLPGLRLAAGGGTKLAAAP